MTKQTKIVCTIGPACDRVTTLTSMIKAGMNVARLNFSHGTHTGHAALVKNVRSAARASGKPLTLIGDLQGPKIRLGELPEKGISLAAGSEVVFSPEKPYEHKTGHLPVTFAHLANDVKPGHRILIDDGIIELVVKKVAKGLIFVKVRNSGKVTSHKGMNFPDSTLSLSSLTPKDHKDIAPSASEDCADVTSRYERYKKQNKKTQFPPIKYEKPPHH